MATETTYNIVKVEELRLITQAEGADHIIINDVDSVPLETKKITAENFAYSIKDYILPIATDEILGGVKIGQGLTINPNTGVLTNDIYALNDLNDVQIANPENRQVLSYDGTKWVNRATAGPEGVIAGDGLIGGGYDGDVELHVNPGRGIKIANDQVQTDNGLGLMYNGNQNAVNNGPGLTFVGTALAVNNGNGIVIDSAGVSVANGRGLTFDAGLVQTDIGRGLRFEGNKVEVYPGRGLRFNGDQLESTSNVTVASAPPTGAGEGDLFWDTDDGNLYIYYDNNGNPVWVPAQGSMADIIQPQITQIFNRLAALEAA